MDPRQEKLNILGSGNIRGLFHTQNVAQAFTCEKIVEICRPAKMWLRNSFRRKLLRFASLGAIVNTSRESKTIL
jgi:hypothetical protein